MGNNQNSARSAFLSLFQLLLSGTHATVDQRIEIVQKLITSTDPVEQNLGFETLDRMLEAWHFNSSHSSDFGSRSRDYGWRPQSQIDIVNWYCPVLAYARQLSFDALFSERIRFMVANKFRGMLIKAHILHELEQLALAIGSVSFWAEGWIAIRKCIRLDSSSLSKEDLARLCALEKALRPNNLIEKASAYIFSKPWGALDIADEEDENCDKSPIEASRYVAETTERLGRNISEQHDILDALLPDLVQGDSARRGHFGKGLAKGAFDLHEMWQHIQQAVVAVPESTRNISVLLGFLAGTAERDQAIANAFLDSLLVDPDLGPLFPLFQTTIAIDEQGEKRLLASLDLGLVPAWRYGTLQYGGATAPISPYGLRQIVLGVASLKDGFEVACDILGMRFHSDHDLQKEVDPDLIECGRELLRNYSFKTRNDGIADYHLSEIAKVCLTSVDAEDDIRMVCRNLAKALSEYRLGLYDIRIFLDSLLSLHPLIILDELLDSSIDSEDLLFQRGIDIDEPSGPIDKVPTEILIMWAQIKPEKRFPLLASVITAYRKNTDEGLFTWSESALEILSTAPDRIAVLKELGDNFRPRGWSGSLAELLQQLRTLPQTFLADSDPLVVKWAHEQDNELQEWAEKERLSERRSDERFE